MKTYHILPMNRQYPDNTKVTAAAKTLKKEVLKALNLDKRNLFYFFDLSSMEKLKTVLQAGDEIVIHAHGNPWLMGLAIASKYDLSAHKIADSLENIIPDHITINLLSCNSGLEYRSKSTGYHVNLARDLSYALQAKNVQGVRVVGYRGYIQADNAYPVNTTTPNSGGVSIHKAKVIYQQGIEIESPIADLKPQLSGYSKSDKKAIRRLIKTAHEYNLSVQENLLALSHNQILSDTNRHSFFRQSTHYPSSSSAVNINLEDISDIDMDMDMDRENIAMEIVV